jgi:TRAP-type C4-dicarboxylate transport system permease small subunit
MFESFFTLKTMFSIAKAFENLHIFLFLTKLSVNICKQAVSTATGGLPIPAGNIYAIAWTAAHWSLLIFLHTAPQWQQRKATKINPRLSAPPCI